MIAGLRLRFPLALKPARLFPEAGFPHGLIPFLESGAVLLPGFAEVRSRVLAEHERHAFGQPGGAAPLAEDPEAFGLKMVDHLMTDVVVLPPAWADDDAGDAHGVGRCFVESERSETGMGCTEDHPWFLFDGPDRRVNECIRLVIQRKRFFIARRIVRTNGFSEA